MLTSGCVVSPERLETEEHLATASYYWGRGDFNASLRESRKALSFQPQLLGDKALFQIGLVYSHPENPDHDLTKAREAFGALINRYPESPLRPQAELWILILRNLQDTEKILVSKKRELLRLKRQLRDRQDQIKKLTDQNKKVISAKDEYYQKLQDHNQKVTDAKDEYYQRAIEEKNRQIRELEENIDKLKEVDIKIEEKKRKVTP